MCSVLIFFPDNSVNDASWLILKKEVQGANIFLDYICSTILKPRPDPYKNFVDNALGWTLCQRIELLKSVVDPWQFGTAPDPYGTAYLRIRIPLFSSVSDKMPTKIKVFFKAFLLITFGRYIYFSFRRSHTIVEMKFFLTFFVCWWNDPDPYKIMTDPVPEGPKNIRIRIHNTVSDNSVLVFSLGMFLIRSSIRYADPYPHPGDP